MTDIGLAIGASAALNLILLLIDTEGLKKEVNPYGTGVCLDHSYNLGIRAVEELILDTLYEMENPA